MSDNIPLSLYVHLPWCIKKCPYCDFNSHEIDKSFDESVYLQALLADLESASIDCQQQSINSIFFGGGTPSLFSADSIFSIIDHARQLFALQKAEITLEANPGTFEAEKFKQFRQAGVNRLSIGVQSFSDQQLRALRRIHNARQSVSAIESAIDAGFDNINIDLMFGLPQQSVEMALNDINMAMRFPLQHISHYQLTIEANTYFHKHRPELPDADLTWEMQTICQQMLADNAFSQYEVSAWAKAGRQCQHNLNYWQFGDYIGIGAGAHGKLTNLTGSTDAVTRLTINRIRKYRQPREYTQKALNNDAISGRQQLDRQAIIFEFLLNALRLKAGVDKATFEQRTGLDFSELAAAVSHVDEELLYIDRDKVVTTDKGYLFLNNILQDLI